jgi:hypothetical protein
MKLKLKNVYNNQEGMEKYNKKIKKNKQITKILHL